MKNVSTPISGHSVWRTHNHHQPCACTPRMRRYSPPASAASTRSSAINTGADHTTQAAATMATAAAASTARIARIGSPASPSTTSVSLLSPETSGVDPDGALHVPEPPAPPEVPPWPAHPEVSCATLLPRSTQSLTNSPSTSLRQRSHAHISSRNRP
ncbi:hypothetical protein [Xanthomonas sp. 10-10]|uniref:Uncharacterized protein n=1 Tax=Xanthomonas sp. 10-10 TaxID=3115848 RepID=A0AAU7P4B7_9XANT